MLASQPYSGISLIGVDMNLMRTATLFLVLFSILSGCVSENARMAEPQDDNVSTANCTPSVGGLRQTVQYSVIRATLVCDNRFGFVDTFGTGEMPSVEYESCVRANAERYLNEILEAGSEAPASNTSMKGDGRKIRWTGYLVDKEASGANTICYYNVYGSTKEMNVHDDNCPVTAEFECF